MAKQYLRLLSKEDLQKIHHASLTILQNTGMLIDHYEARKMIRAAGADVEDEKKIVKFPPELVEKCLKAIPRRLLYAGRNLENDLILQADGGIYARTASSLTSYLDLETRRYRRGTIDDLNQWTALADALPNIHCCGTNHAEDVPAQTADIHATRVLLSNQRKHFFAASFSVKNLKYMIEMALTVRGSKEAFKKRPLFHSLIGIISPLSIPEDDVNMLFLAGEFGVPMIVCSEPNVGATGPITLAGTIAQTNAEFLGASTLAQIIHPGIGIPYYLLPTVFDMSTGRALLGSPENALIQAALCQLGSEFYRLPVEISALCADGVISEQIIFQKASATLMASLSGANLLCHAGTIDTALAASPVHLVIDDEIMAVMHRMWQGIEVNHDTLGLDAIARIGPLGNFLTDPHTLKYLRSEEHFRPTIFDRDSSQAWYAKGSKRLEQRAREKALDILAKHEVEPLPEEVQRELIAIVSKADQELIK